MKRTYVKPSLTAYGKVQNLTLGNAGNKPDFISAPGGIIQDPNNPTCENNVVDSFTGCIHT